MKKYNYRLLEHNDVRDYRQIWLECLRMFPDSFGSLYEEERSNPKLFFEQYLEGDSPDNFMIGAYDSSYCVGISGFIREARPRTRHRGSLVQMYVRPAYQGQGIAYELIRRVADRAFVTLGVEQVILGVVANNVSANRLYERMGFEEYGLVKNYFKVTNGYQDQRLMIKYRD